MIDGIVNHKASFLHSSGGNGHFLQGEPYLGGADVDHGGVRGSPEKIKIITIDVLHSQIWCLLSLCPLCVVSSSLNLFTPCCHFSFPFYLSTGSLATTAY